MTNVVSAKIGRFGEEVREFVLNCGDPVRKLFEVAGMELSPSEEVVDSDSNHITMEDQVKDGEKYFLVAKYKSGI